MGYINRNGAWYRTDATGAPITRVTEAEATGQGRGDTAPATESVYDDKTRAKYKMEHNMNAGTDDQIKEWMEKKAQTKALQGMGKQGNASTTAGNQD